MKGKRLDVNPGIPATSSRKKVEKKTGNDRLRTTQPAGDSGGVEEAK